MTVMGWVTRTTCTRFLEPANWSRSAKMKGPPCGSEPSTERTRLGMKNEPTSYETHCFGVRRAKAAAAASSASTAKPMTYVSASARRYRRHRRNCHCTQSTNEGPQCFRSRRKTLEAPAHSLSGGWEESSMRGPRSFFAATAGTPGRRWCRSPWREPDSQACAN